MALVLLTAGCSEEPRPEWEAGGRLRLGSILGETDLEGFARADEPRSFSFPLDHGPHPGYRSEWWYLTLVLSDPSGVDIGVQFTLFRQALAPQAPGLENRWQSPQVYLAHFAVTDGESGHRSAERFARGHPALAGVESEPFALWLENWRMEEVDGRWRLTAAMDGASVALDLAMPVPIVLQGERGLSRKGPDQASYYYSMPRIPASGQVIQNGVVRQVEGLGWLDREWSTSVLSGGQKGWDWFALQFDDGRCLMVFQLRREDGTRDPYDQGLLIGADGSTRHLGARDFQLLPLEVWRDGEGTEWPVSWRVQVDEEIWRVTAVVDDQRMDTSVTYWEGLVLAHDASGERVGRGYLELTGYGDVAAER
jgi:predicted secreted hydrolase